MRSIDVTIVGRISALGIVSMLLASPSAAVVLHDDASQVPPAERPDDALIGRWSDNASCVPVGPNHVVTTRHQGGGGGSTVVLGGVAYRVEWAHNHPQADLRVVRLSRDGGDANLSAYAPMYTETDELHQVVVMGGYGMGRDGELTTEAQPYGYWCAGDGNDILRWARNQVDKVVVRTSAGYTADTLWADFDGVGEGGDVAYEGRSAHYDSGAGWFLQDGGEWHVAGLTWTVLTHYAEGHEYEPEYSQAWYRYDENPQVLAPDPMDAIRVSSYADWITGMMAVGAPGDSNGDGAVNILDLGVLAAHYRQTGAVTYADGDFNGDGVVNILDLGILAGRYRWSGMGPAGGDAGGDLVPEPGAVVVVALALAALRGRRRRRQDAGTRSTAPSRA